MKLDHPDLLTIAPEQLVDAARRVLHSAEQSALDIYSQTGLTPAWQHAFISQRAKDPAFTRMVRLLEWLNDNHGEALAAAIAEWK